MKTNGRIAYPALELPALTKVRQRRVLRWLGRLLLVALAVAPFVLVFAPWQQNLPGQGRLIEFDPVNRPMPLQARTDGILLRWHVREGQQVEKGDPIVDLGDNDPDILQRLEETIQAAERKRDAAIKKREQFDAQVAAAELARTAAIQYADDEIAAAEQDVAVKKADVKAAEADLHLASVALEMWTGMVEDKIGAGFKLQEARQKYGATMAELNAKKAAVTGAEAKLRAARSSRKRVDSAEAVKVQSAKAKRDEADGDIAIAEGSLPKLRRDLKRQQQQRITAPIDGFVQNLTANGQGGGYVKAGTTLATLVPHGSQLAVELLVDGNDVTFIDVGRHVRLQFEGWPAIQWVGWPSAAVGTFGGTVAFVDRSDDGTGRFRVMVLPDEESPMQPEGPISDWLRRMLTFDKVHRTGNPFAWPREYLRQGGLVKGWIVLDRVSIGFEIWRQLNGFPPRVDRTLKGDEGNKK